MACAILPTDPHKAKRDRNLRSGKGNKATSQQNQQRSQFSQSFFHRCISKQGRVGGLPGVQLEFDFTLTGDPVQFLGNQLHNFCAANVLADIVGSDDNVNQIF